MLVNKEKISKQEKIKNHDQKKKSNNIEIPVYVRRTFDLILDTNGYPHTEDNRQALYTETIKRMSPDGITNIKNEDLFRTFNYEEDLVYHPI